MDLVFQERRKSNMNKPINHYPEPPTPPPCRTIIEGVCIGKRPQTKGWFWNPEKLIVTRQYSWICPKTIVGRWESKNGFLTIVGSRWTVNVGYTFNNCTGVPSGDVDLSPDLPVKSLTSQPVYDLWRASIWHDLSYENLDDPTFPFTRKEVDSYFVQNMQLLQYSHAKLYYYGVRYLGGIVHWIGSFFKIASVTLLLNGCITPPVPPHPVFPQFVTTPKDMVGYGADCFWLYTDAEVLADTLVKNNVNCTRVEPLNCSPTKVLSQSADPSPHGYWTMDKFDSQLKPQLDKFLTTMQNHKITTIVTLFGGHKMAGITGDMEMQFLNFLNSRPSKEGIIINVAAEAGPNSPKAVFDSLTLVLDTHWNGMKVWNYGTRPVTAPAGYFVEYHPQLINEYGPMNGNIIMVSDSYVWFLLNIDSSLQSKIDPAKMTPYVKNIRSKGNGFISYGQRFTGWDIDTLGIQSIGAGR